MKVIKPRKNSCGGYYARIDFFGRDKERPNRAIGIVGETREEVRKLLDNELKKLKK